MDRKQLKIDAYDYLNDQLSALLKDGDVRDWTTDNGYMPEEQDYLLSIIEKEQRRLHKRYMDLQFGAPKE